MTDLERELLAVLQAIVDLEEMKKANSAQQMKDFERERDEGRRIAQEAWRLLAQPELPRRLNPKDVP